MRRFRFIIGLLVALVISPVAEAQIINITIAPPELPVYVQPPLPAPGYIWTPGYWAYGPDGYYWVPGTWVEPPAVGLLWTPGYWAWRDGVYAWNAGYWGPRVGFYGGVNYGFGYAGVGYEGGHWDNGVLAYNRTVNNFGGVNVTNVYSKTVINNVTRVSFNGGSGGITTQPTAQERVAAQDHHVAPAPAQIQQQHLASTNRALLASENHGRPAIAATAKPGEFTGKGIVAAREAKPGPAPLPQPVVPKVPANNAVANKPLESKPAAATPPANKPVANNPPAANKPLENRAPADPEHIAAHGALPKPPNAMVRPEAKPLNATAKPANVAAKPVAAPPTPKPAAVAAAPKLPQHPPVAAAPRQVAAASHSAPHRAPHPPAAKPNVSPHKETH